jgi:hypothetical protein
MPKEKFSYPTKKGCCLIKNLSAVQRTQVIKLNANAKKNKKNEKECPKNAKGRQKRKETLKKTLKTTQVYSISPPC